MVMVKLTHGINVVNGHAGTAQHIEMFGVMVERVGYKPPS